MRLRRWCGADKGGVRIKRYSGSHKGTQSAKRKVGRMEDLTVGNPPMLLCERLNFFMKSSLFKRRRCLSFLLFLFYEACFLYRLLFLLIT